VVVPVTLAPDTPSAGPGGLLPDLARLLRDHLARPRRGVAAPPEAAEVPSPQEALVRALCHDMRRALETALSVLDRTGPASADRVEVLELARAQAAHLHSLLRTADATGGAPARAPRTRRLGDVVAASVAASGLPAARLSVECLGTAADVAVADARVQRVLTNLLENAHRHGGGAPVRLRLTRRPGWVDLALRQEGLRPAQVVGHLTTPQPPVDLTGLGLWSVQRQTRELGGRVLWDDDGAALTLTVRLPDR
jgi:signal transduction histidine kinase